MHEIYSTELDEAKRLFAKGATRGMVDSRLKKMNLPDHVRLEILDRANKSVHRTGKAKSLIVLAMGLFLITCTVVGLVYVTGEAQRNGFFRGRSIKTLVAVGVAGLVISLLGISGLLAKPNGISPK